MSDPKISKVLDDTYKVKDDLVGCIHTLALQVELMQDQIFKIESRLIVLGRLARKTHKIATQEVPTIHTNNDPKIER